MSDKPIPILDWVPRGGADDLVFERASIARCKPRRIGRKVPGTLRVAVYGESLAAGFPLAPAFTPSIALEEILAKALADERRVEVLDLSMPNMGPSEQLRVAEASRFLEPDVCIFFTGNNWYYGLPVEPTAAPEARARYAEVLAREGAPGLAEAFRNELDERARVMVDALASAAKAAGAAAFFVAPACNHAWERLNPPPALGNGRTARWFETLERAERAEALGHWSEVLAIASELTSIEGTLTGTPERLRTRALAALGQHDEARDAAMDAVAACNWQNYTWALPQAPRRVTDRMRAGAAAAGARFVDLAEVFERHTGRPSFGFELFFDHCHLTADGVRIAMASVARNLLDTLACTKVPELAEAIELAPLPSSAHSASGALQAAHWLSQFYPTALAHDAPLRIEAFLNEATRLERTHLDVLVDFVALRDPSCAPGLHARLPRAGKLPGVAAVLTSPRLNPLLVNAALAHLEVHAPARVDDALTPLIEAFRASLRRGLDLTAPRFRAWFWERTPTAWYDPQERQGSPIFRSLWRESQFAFVADGETALALEAVWRTASSRGEVRCRVNGVEVLTAERTTDSWHRSSVHVARAHVRRGVNVVTIRWPALAVDEDALLRDAAARFRLGAEADFFCSFGELFSLTVRTLEAS